MTSSLLMRQHSHTLFIQKNFLSRTRFDADRAFFAMSRKRRRKTFFSWASLLGCLWADFSFRYFSLLRSDFASEEHEKTFFFAFHILYKILSIFKNGTFLVFNYNLFNHETAAKLYTERTFISRSPYMLEQEESFIFISHRQARFAVRRWHGLT